jgi:hypothetical protein
MIRFTTGNIMTSHAEALVNTVNCIGIMGGVFAGFWRKIRNKILIMSYSLSYYVLIYFPSSKINKRVTLSFNDTRDASLLKRTKAGFVIPMLYLERVVTQTYQWNSRKRQFSRGQIETAIETLRSKNWLTNGMG